MSFNTGSRDSGLLDQIDHFVVIMLENRSFDHMLGFLYTDQNNISPLGHAFEGLTGEESNLNSRGEAVTVFKIPDDKHPYFWPGSDPGEGYNNTNSQLFGNYRTPAKGTKAGNSGFISDFAYTLNWQRQDNEKKPGSWPIVEGTTEESIMGMYTPQLLPVLSGLAKGYAVCDHWFCSVPTETLPNRAFVQMATSLGRLNDHDKRYNAPSIYNLLEQAQLSWSIYGYEDEPILTRQSLQALPEKPEYGSFGNFAAFKRAATDGTLAHYSFLAPEWGSKGNSQHPNYDVAKGEQYLYEIYQALQSSPHWQKTLLIITYDEHGGNFDHVPPPENAKQPHDCPDNMGFNFQRFGVRVPTVLVSPLIEAGTVLRIPEPDTDLYGNSQAPTAFDHTSILATVEKRFKLSPLTTRDAAAPDIGPVLTLTTARRDDPLKNVVVPKSEALPVLEGNSDWSKADHLQQAEASLASQLPVEGDYHSHYQGKGQDDESEVKRYSRYRYHHYYYGQYKKENS
ncbi:alkaline phosphatase family protein [Thalassomonas haliotis]|uniref:Phosphoesterase n=1 Tax=Thalassomonas haliotis TaxID=485448 RepID=A0ABY7VIB3_9GAMM|nr:alkaline phosphatase family protein [Thalassomonas haliotis]WDE13475.1 phosphoesterase [Thalassomonas haliotis]